MIDSQLKQQLNEANSLEEVQDVLKDNPEINAERLWQELENHRSAKTEKLDLDELDAVSGGADRDWEKDGCAATCEWSSWCWSNDNCVCFDVTYDNFWRTCPDGHEHVWQDHVCTRCGFAPPHNPDDDSHYPR